MDIESQIEVCETKISDLMVEVRRPKPDSTDSIKENTHKKNQLSCEDNVGSFLQNFDQKKFE